MPAPDFSEKILSRKGLIGSSREAPSWSAYMISRPEKADLQWRVAWR